MRLYDQIPQIDRPEELFDLQGHVIVIVGGGKMCRSYGTTLSHAGALLVIIDISQEACDLSAEAIREKTGGPSKRSLATPRNRNVSRRCSGRSSMTTADSMA